MRARGELWVPVLVALAWLGEPSRAAAFDVELDSDTSFQIYEVRTPGARAFMARRRLLSRLSLRVAHDFTEPDADGRVLRLTAEAQLRLEQDFGETCLLEAALCVDAVNANDPGAWQPLAADTRLDVPAVWGEISGLPLGTTARLGRQLALDAIGFARFDGITVRVVPLRWLRAETQAGLLVRGTSLAGTSRSDPAGSMRLDAPGVPWAAPPVDTWVAGASLEGGPGRWLQLRLAYRHMWEDDGQVISRASGELSSQPVSWLRLDASGVWDLMTSEAIASNARLSVGEGAVVVATGISRHVPRFDPGTIWAWFAVAPISQADVGVRWRPSDDVSLGGSLRGRWAELSDDNRNDDLDAGADAWLHARFEGIDFGASGFLWSGSLGPLAGVSVDARRRFFGWLEIGLDVSVWHFDDPNRQNLFGTVLSEALSGRVRLSPETQILVELQHATSRVVGHRFRGIVALRLDTWR